jgi:very-short-patch-repair endonuclease
MSTPLVRFNELSAQQHGPVTRSQALAAGLTARQLHGRVAKGELLVPYRGIYVPSSVPASPSLSIMAACLYTGGHASHACAAFLWRLRGFQSETIEVTIPYGRSFRPAGLIVHRSRNIDSRDRCAKAGIPLTTVAKTLIDIAGTHPELAEGALNDAVARAKTRRYRLESTLARAGTRGCEGAVLLRKLLAELKIPTESELEDAFVAFIRRYRLPEPERQIPIGGRKFRLDFGWSPIKFAVEVDGAPFHSSPAERRRDRAKVAQARKEGWTVHRAYWDDINEGADGLAAELGAELLLRGHAAWTGLPRAA